MNYSSLVVRGEPLIPRLMKEGRLSNSALIVPGGGFQGTRSGGMLCVLDALSLNEAFNAAYGVSCGVANIAHFLSRQTISAASVYYEDLVDGRYASLFRRPIVNMDYLVYDVLQRQKRLYADRVAASLTDFHIAVSNSRGEAVFFRINIDVGVLDGLRLAMSFPFYTSGGFSLRGEEYYDGMMTNPIPFRKALADGYTNIVVLLNMPFEWEDACDNFLLKALKWAWAKNQAGDFRRRYFNRQARYREQLSDLLGGGVGEANITVIAPSQFCTKVDFYTRKVPILRSSTEDGIRIMEEALDVRLDLQIL